MYVPYPRRPINGLSILPLYKKIIQPNKMYRVGNMAYREQDNIIAGIYGMSERATGFTPEETAINYVEENKEKFGIKGRVNGYIRHFFTRKGDDGSVVRFRQYFKGLPVDQNEIVITFNTAGNIVFLLNSIQPIKSDFNIAATVSQSRSEQTVLAHFALKEAPEKQQSEKIIHFVDGMPQLCYRIRFTLAGSPSDWISYVDARTGTASRYLANRRQRRPKY